MEARDSTSQSAPAANQEASSAVAGGAEDEAGLSVAAALAKDAALHFQSCRFAECLDVLRQLALKKVDDPKILHNMAIAEYFRDGCSDPKKLLEVLNNVKRKSEELASVTHERIEGATSLGNKVVSVSKGSSMETSLSASNSASLGYMDEFDPAVATLNIAIVWFHLHEYCKALSVLEPLYQNIEPVDEGIAIHVCLLLLDVALACQEASKVADALNYLEKAFGVGCMSQSDNGGMAPQQSAIPGAKISSIGMNLSVADSSTDVASSGIPLENSLSRSLSLSEDTLEYDETMFSLDMTGQNLVKPAGFSSSSDSSRTLVDRSLSMVDLKLKLQLYKVRFLLLTRNLKQAKREVKLAMNIARGRDSSTALLLKSELEYSRGNHRKAIKLLMASTNRTEIGMASMLNNLGCIYYQLGKYHLSSALFSKALTSCSSLRKEKSLKLLTSAPEKSLFIFYNSGMQHLVCGKPLLAYRCFQKASLVLYNRPVLWLRLAECCLMAFEKGLSEVGQLSSEKSDVLVHVVGKGKWRHLVIGDGKLKNEHADSGDSEDFKTKLSLSMARQFLFNGLQLLESHGMKNMNFDLNSNLSLGGNESDESGSIKRSNHKNFTSLDAKASPLSTSSSQLNSNGDAKETKVATGQEITQNSILYHEEVRRRENHMIKQALLGNLAYVQLELENPDKALSAARSLLEVPECSRIYLYLGHAYAAEALCLLNKPKEAAEHLSTYLSGGHNVDLPFSQEDCEQWRAPKAFDFEEPNGGAVASKIAYPEDSHGVLFPNPEEAQGTLYANFAVINAFQGDLERAHHFVTQALSLLPNSREVTLTAIYVDLKLGQPQSAISRLKESNRVRFVPAAAGVEPGKC